ncbi:MAG: hypothetical protein PVI86_03315 [Phycisphaerae bacterium]
MRRTKVVAFAALMVVGAIAHGQVIRPTKDGTIADGGIYGPFGGGPDQADWYFNESSFEGSITLSRDTLEHRVVWEYNLGGVSLEPPVEAILSATIRGARIYPFPDVVIHVYAYPADLQERLSDFDAGPALLQGTATIIPYQDPADYTFDVSAVVNDALTSGDDKVAFRFQVNPFTFDPNSQAFIDALDAEPETKPYITVSEPPAAPGDYDRDGDVDDADYLAFLDCMGDPGAAGPSGCEDFDFDHDDDVDYFDYFRFAGYFTGP